MVLYGFRYNIPHVTTEMINNAPMDHAAPYSTTKMVNKSKDHAATSLLTKEENEQLFKLMGCRCQAVSTTVIQLYSTDGPDGIQWIKRDVGILCLVKDSARRSYFFRLYCLFRSRMVWEHEVYNSMQYLSPKTYLHTFEAEECVVAFNFANEMEATRMMNVLLDKLKTKEQKRMDRRTSKANCATPGPWYSTRPPLSIPSATSIPNETSKSASLFSSLIANFHKEKKHKKRNTVRITKAAKSLPQDFCHVTHVGWNSTAGLELNNVSDPHLYELLIKAGVSDRDMNDNGRREFIYDFIKKNNWNNVMVKKESSSPPAAVVAVPAPPLVPTRSLQLSSSLRSAPPPHPPLYASPRPMLPPPTSPPPTPPPITTIPARHTQEKETRWRKSPPFAPPPPLMPPPDMPQQGLPMVTATQAKTMAPDPRSELMNAIRSGKTLKHLDVEENPLPAYKDTRNELLSQIRRGVELKSVQTTEKPCQNGVALDGLAAVLAKAMAERFKATHSSSSDSDFDEDEWKE